MHSLSNASPPVLAAKDDLSASMAPIAVSPTVADIRESSQIVTEVPIENKGLCSPRRRTLRKTSSWGAKASVLAGRGSGRPNTKDARSPVFLRDLNKLHGVSVPREKPAHLCHMRETALRDVGVYVPVKRDNVERDGHL